MMGHRARIATPASLGRKPLHHIVRVIVRRIAGVTLPSDTRRNATHIGENNGGFMEDSREDPTRPRTKLVLLIDADPTTRDLVRPLLAPRGLEVIQARNSVAGLEILQRLLERFRLAIVNLEMPGLSGAVMIETLRVCRPELPVVCLTATERTAVAAASSNCLSKPLQPAELRSQVEDALAGIHQSVTAVAVDPEALARAKLAFEASGNLLDAARELARGMPSEPASEW
jgi:CheY-like chemotaxis protein